MKRVLFVSIMLTIVIATASAVSSLIIYNIGDKGPAGGYIFYDCDADNESGNDDKLISSECGWRYLEAAPEDLGHFIFAVPKETVETEYLSSGVLMTQYHSVNTDIGIGSGKKNTEILYENIDTAQKNAVSMCLGYSLNGYDDWFLPSIKELQLMKQNIREHLTRKGAQKDYIYYSSSYNANLREVQVLNIRNGMTISYKGMGITYLNVRPVRFF